MIVILDYDMGNVGSIQNILNKIGQKDVLISRETDAIDKADKLVPVSYTHLRAHETSV